MTVSGHTSLHDGLCQLGRHLNDADEGRLVLLGLEIEYFLPTVVHDDSHERLVALVLDNQIDEPQVGPVTLQRDASIQKKHNH